MPKRCLIICLLLFSITVFAQKPTDKGVPIFFEKAYLHTDRNTYAQGDDLWFKAYVVNAQNNAPIDYSKNLYVELISPSAKVVQRKMLRLEKGLCNGDFKLPDTLAIGNYRIRAYTNWMRNFGDNFIFEKDIRIISDVFSTAVVSPISATKKKPAKTNTLPKINADTLPVARFFPEGGSMVNGLSAIVAVKTEDSKGKGVPATGKVLNNAGETVASFICDSLGFGQFALLPDATQHYRSIVNIRHKDCLFTLPEVAISGFNLHIQVKQPNVLIAIRCDEASFSKPTGQHIYLNIKHGGKTIIKKALEISTKDLQVNLTDDLLAGGINCISLSNQKNQPLCERLIYIDHPPGTRLAINADKPIYQPKQQAAIHFKLNKPGIANLSLAAVDALTVPVPPENIMSYMGLQSEVRGNIEQVARYFDTTNVNRAKQMDLLLLTQGWRNYVWKRLEDTTLNFDREPEQGITITGTVRKAMSSKGLPGIHVQVNVPNAKGERLFEAVTGADGRFAVYGPVFYGYQYLLVSSHDFESTKGSKTDAGGDLSVDSLNLDPMPVSASNNYMADAPPLTEEIAMGLKIPQKQQLKQVNISSTTYKIPPKVHVVTAADQDYGTVLQYLLYQIPGLHLLTQIDKETGFVGSHYATPPDNQISFPLPLHYSDGTEVDMVSAFGRRRGVFDVFMSALISITLQKHFDNRGIWWSVIPIFKPGSLDFANDKNTAGVPGYYLAKEFYKPTTQEMDANIDTRTNTLHWEPNITTDKNGEATVSFYNTAQKGKIRLVVQGITESGEPVYQTLGYEVK